MASGFKIQTLNDIERFCSVDTNRYRFINSNYRPWKRPQTRHFGQHWMYSTHCKRCSLYELVLMKRHIALFVYPYDQSDLQTIAKRSKSNLKYPKPIGWVVPFKTKQCTLWWKCIWAFKIAQQLPVERQCKHKVVRRDSQTRRRWWKIVHLFPPIQLEK